MRKRNQEPPWQPKHKQAETAPKIPMLEKLAANALSFRKLLLELSLIAVAAIGLGLLIKEVLHEEIILEPIEVPEDIAKQGYTGMVIAEQIADVALVRQQEVRDFSEPKPWFKQQIAASHSVSTNAHLPDITVPGAPFSLRAIARFIRHELNLPSTYIRGELVHDRNTISLSLRNLSEPIIPAIRVDKSSQQIRQLIQESGDALLKLTTPSVIAILNYYQFYENNQHDKKINPAYDKVMQNLEYCLKYPPKTDDAFINSIWGITLNDLERWDEAIEKFKHAAELDPKNPYAYNNWGAPLNNLKRYDEAITKFQKAIDLDPNFAIAYYNWGVILTKQKRHQEAITKFRKAIELDPKKANAFYDWGYALDALERYDEAIAKYQKATELDPKNAGAFFNWGYALNELKRYDKAIAKYEKATELDPKNAGAFNNWGYALDELKRYDEAIAKYHKAVEIDPKNDKAYKNWGVVLKKIGKTKEAEEKFKKAKELKAEKSEKANQQTD